MENRINSILELANGEKYVVINQAVYKGTNYFLVARISDDEKDLIGDIKIAEEKLKDGLLGIELVKDVKLLELLTKYLGPQE